MSASVLAGEPASNDWINPFVAVVSLRICGVPLLVLP